MLIDGRTSGRAYRPRADARPARPIRDRSARWRPSGPDPARLDPFRPGSRWWTRLSHWWAFDWAELEAMADAYL